MVDGMVQRPCAGDVKAVALVRASRRWRLGKVGKAPPKSRGEHASRACCLHVPLNFTDALLTDAVHPHHFLITHMSLHHVWGGKWEEAIGNTSCCDEDFFRSHAGST